MLNRGMLLIAQVANTNWVLILNNVPAPDGALGRFLFSVALYLSNAKGLDHDR